MSFGNRGYLSCGWRNFWPREVYRNNVAGSVITRFLTQRDEVEKAINSFAELELCAIPRAVGAIDDTHFEIIAPEENAFHYFNLI